MELITLEDITTHVCVNDGRDSGRIFAAEQPEVFQYLRQYCPADTDLNSMLMGAITMYALMRHKEAL